MPLRRNAPIKGEDKWDIRGSTDWSKYRMAMDEDVGRWRKEREEGGARDDWGETYKSLMGVLYRVARAHVGVRGREEDTGTVVME